MGRSVDVGFEGRIANHVGIVDLLNRISAATRQDDARRDD